MKIAVDASQVKVAEADGMSTYSYYLLRALSKLNQPHKFILFFREEASQKVKKEFFRGSETFEFRVLEESLFWRQTSLAKACLKYKPDLLFVPGATLPVFRDPQLKTVITAHDLCFDYLPERYQLPQKILLGKSVKYASYMATRVIAVSQATKDALVEQFKVDPEKISVVYEGVDQEKFHPPAGGPNFKLQNQRGEEIKKKYGIEGDYILFVGTVQPRKNLRRAIEAFSLIAKDLNFSDLQFIIAGRPGWLFDEIYSAPKEFGVEEKVNFLGSVPDQDLSVLYQGAELLLFPSLCEGFGLPILEAMASGIPVITSNISSMPEVGGKSAYYVDPYDVKDIVYGLQLILEDDNLHQTLASSGRERAEVFSWRRTAKKTLKVLEFC